ncbi:MAG: carbohydrate ABC transporter permease [Erysipelotrichaceae bacterium]|nr:carbohydrate ABC transporter permease [Erysipelotrichaceae bacterium]
MKNTNKKARFLLIISRILAYGFVIFLCFLCLFCFLLLILMASKSNSQMQGAFNFRWGGHFMENLYNAWNDFSINIPVGMVNSFVVAMSSAVITTYFSALTAYGVHVYNFKLKNVIFTFIMAIMMIPSQVSAVGFIQLAYKFGLTNKLWLLIIPSIAAPVVFFYMKQYLESVLPIEMVEAARIDGSNEFRIFNEIVLPIMKPAVAVQMIFSFVSSWNNYFMPALLLTKEKYKTVPIMIANLRSADYSKFDQGKVFMFILLAILPVMVVYTILSKSIIKGVTSGSVKG